MPSLCACVLREGEALINQGSSLTCQVNECDAEVITTCQKHTKIK